MKHFFIVSLAFLIFLIMGCTNFDDKGNGDNDSEFPTTMTGLFIIHGTEYQMEEGNYRWERKKGFETEVVTTDHASPYQLANQIEAVSVNPNQVIDIKIEENPDITVYLWNNSGREKEIEQDGNQIIAPSNKGKYIYEVLAEWKNGTISYTFVVEVQ